MSKKKPTSSEKRKHPRFPMGISFDVVAKGQSVRRCRGTIADLSVGGMSFASDAILEPGASLYLRINIPLEIRGEIRHVKPAAGGWHYGVSFHKLGFSSPSSARPERFIDAKFHKLVSRRKA